MNIHEKLLTIQVGLKAPKSQYNSFGKYAYRSASDIMEAVKPWLQKLKCTLVLNDDLIPMGEEMYLKSTAILTDAESEKGEYIQVSGYAREDHDAKGMSAPQMSGSVSSYTHKYVLGQLLLIDDTKDPDTEEYQSAGKEKQKQTQQKPKETAKKPEPEVVKLKDGRTIPKDYYDACKKEWNGKKLVSIYEEDKDLFNNILTSGEPSFKAAAEVIKNYKEKKA